MGRDFWLKQNGNARLSQKLGFPLLLALTGCVTATKPQPAGNGLYTISATSDGLSSATRAREKAYTQGQEQCAKLGKQFTVRDERSEPTRMGIDTTITVVFACE